MTRILGCARFPSALVTIAFLALAGCTRKKADDPRTLRFPLSSDAAGLDPQTADTGISVFLLDQVSSTLFQYDSQQRVLPYDAESFAWQKDGAELLVRVRRDLTWSDGQPLRACQYRDGVLRALDPKFPSNMADLLFEIRNARERKAGKAKESDVGVVCDDAQSTLVFRPVRPNAWRILHALAFVVSSPVRKEAIEARGESWMLPKDGAPGLATGAFRAREWAPDRRVILEARSLTEKNLPEDRRAGVDRLDMPVVKDPNTAYALYMNGEIDVLPEVPTVMIPKVVSRPDRVLSPYFTTYMVGFSLVGNPALKDSRVRQALSLTLSRDEIPALLQGGEQPGYGWVPPGLLNPVVRPKSAPFDPERARKLLREAGYRGKRKFPTLKLFYNSGERHQLLMERAANNWKTHLGIQVELNPMEWKVLVATIKGKAPDLWRYAWAAVYPDPVFFLDLYTTHSQNNYGRWSNANYDRLVAKLGDTPLDKRDDAFWKDVERAQKILVEEDPALIPIYHYVRNTLVRSTVKGLEFNWRGTGYLRGVRKEAQP